MAWIRNRLCGLRVGGLLRVLLLVAAAQLLGLALWLHSAHARAGEMLLSVGAELMKMTGSQSNNPARTLFLNGSAIHLRTATTAEDVRTVLDGFHALCRARTGIEAPDAAFDKARKVARKGGSGPTALDGVLITQNDSEGAIACVDTGARLSLAELTERLHAFAKSGDLKSVGELRYVLARRVDGKTTVLMMWTEGSIPLLTMFPATGDAPGQDPPDVARPPEARRILSARDGGEPYSVTAYAATGGRIAAMVAFYEKDLRSKGWALEIKSVGTAESNVTVITAHRSGRTLVVRIGHDNRGSVVVSIAALG